MTVRGLRNVLIHSLSARRSKISSINRRNETRVKVFSHSHRRAKDCRYSVATNCGRNSQTALIKLSKLTEFSIAAKTSIAAKWFRGFARSGGTAAYPTRTAEGIGKPDFSGTLGHLAPAACLIGRHHVCVCKPAGAIGSRPSIASSDDSVPIDFPTDTTDKCVASRATAISGVNSAAHPPCLIGSRIFCC